MSRRRDAATLALLGALGAAAPAPARAAGQDAWLGADKAKHFGATAAIGAWGYAGGALLSDDRRVRAAAGAGAGIAAGAAKELWDLSGHGDPSWKDFTWDVIGTATGVAVTLALDWLVARLARPREAAVTRGP